MCQRRITSVAEYVRTMPKILKSYKQCLLKPMLRGAAMKAEMWQSQTILKPWQSPIIYGNVDMLTAKGKDEPPPGKCAGGNDVWTMWGHGTPHCGALS